MAGIERRELAELIRETRARLELSQVKFTGIFRLGGIEIMPPDVKTAADILLLGSPL